MSDFFKAKSAVSDPEKKADRNRRIIKTMKFIEILFIYNDYLRLDLCELNIIIIVKLKMEIDIFLFNFKFCIKR